MIAKESLTWPINAAERVIDSEMAMVSEIARANLAEGVIESLITTKSTGVRVYFEEGAIKSEITRDSDIDDVNRPLRVIESDIATASGMPLPEIFVVILSEIVRL